MKIVVLGAGLVGNVIARDLAKDKDLSITAVDINKDVLNKLAEKSSVEVIKADLSDTNKIKNLVKNFDLVIGAVPGFMGYQTLKTVIEAGKNVVDISFFAQDPFTLDNLAKENNVTAIVDCGVAPGLSNIILGYVDSLFDKTNRFLCYVGGLPKVRTWPYEYKAPFSPSDVIEEYIRPARYIHNGKLITKPALSEAELLEFEDIGTLEAFNTDGLRTLLDTMDIPNMKEKTLRYPGHIEKMKMLRETGFFSNEVIDIDGQEIAPLGLTSKLLFPEWKLEEGEEDLTVMEITIEGIKDKKLIQHNYYLLDHYDKKEKMLSMARTTGFTCSIMARLVIHEKYTKKGIIPPEYIGKNPIVYQNLMDELEKRNVSFKTKIRSL